MAAGKHRQEESVEESAARPHQARQTEEWRNAELEQEHERLRALLEEQERTGAELRESNERLLAVLNSIDSFIYIADMESHELLFVNEHAKKAWGKREFVGRKCHEALQGKDEPCAFCTNGRLVDKEGRAAGVVQWEYHNPVVDRWYDLRDCAIRWTDGRLVRMEIATDVTDRKRTEEALRKGGERLEEINACLASLGVDYPANVARLTALCGRLLGATCALYNRMDRGMLCSVGEWQTPRDYDPKDRPEGHICYDVIRGGGREPVAIARLWETEYAKSDPNVSRYGLKSYMGHPVQCGRDTVGSICAVFQEETAPAADDLRILGVIASALSREEERNRAEERLRLGQERLDLAMEAANAGLWDWNMELREVYFDARYYTMAGYEPDEFPPAFEEWERRVHPDDVGASLEAIRAYCAGETPTFYAEFRFLRKDGSWMWIRGHGQAMERDAGGAVVRMVGTHVDITALKKAQQAALAKNQELEQLIYVASHDLRSPLVNVDGYGRELEYALAEIVHEVECGDPGSGNLASILKRLVPDMSASLGHVRNSTKQMEGLLKGLLKLSRLGRAALTIQKLDMDALVGRVASTMEYQIRKAGAAVAIGPLPACRGDETQVAQIFANLLGNALKYLDAKRAGSITIRGEAGRGRSTYWVEDNGVGIPEDKREKIFELFYRIEPGKAEGEGLGLTIVKRAIERLDGEIAVESEVGKGSRFRVVMPRGDGGQETEGAAGE